MGSMAGGAVLMRDAIRGLKAGTLPDLENRKSEGSYYTFPKPHEVAQFRGKGLRLL